MRVIAGKFRGRTIHAPKGEETRPTTDRVRESVFSALVSLMGAELGGGSVLDAFAGSGALGIEALSRGCKSATFIDSSRDAVRVLQANLDSLGASGVARIVQGDAMSLAEGCALPGGPFALLLLDPPYRLAATDIEGFTSALARYGSIVDEAVIVYEHASDTPVEWRSQFDLVTRKKYGSTGIDIVAYQKGRGSS